eukprot:6351871-Amphidinium_carterae.1
MHYDGNLWCFIFRSFGLRNYWSGGHSLYCTTGIGLNTTFDVVSHSSMLRIPFNAVSGSLARRLPYFVSAFPYLLARRFVLGSFIQSQHQQALF